jgi:hypothetical protein
MIWPPLVHSVAQSLRFVTLLSYRCLPLLSTWKLLESQPPQDVFSSFLLSFPLFLFGLPYASGQAALIYVLTTFTKLQVGESSVDGTINSPVQCTSRCEETKSANHSSQISIACRRMQPPTDDATQWC